MQEKHLTCFFFFFQSFSSAEITEFAERCSPFKPWLWCKSASVSYRGGRVQVFVKRLFPAAVQCVLDIPVDCTGAHRDATDAEHNKEKGCSCREACRDRTCPLSCPLVIVFCNYSISTFSIWG